MCWSSSTNSPPVRSLPFPCQRGPSDLIQGTLDALTVKSLATAPRHGWAIAKRIQIASATELQVQQGATLPRTASPRAQGLLRGEWRTNETGREVTFYVITKAGRAQLKHEVNQ
jgi:DNA-binding PadR family transcriptional regulator